MRTGLLVAVSSLAVLAACTSTPTTTATSSSTTTPTPVTSTTSAPVTTTPTTPPPTTTVPPKVPTTVPSPTAKLGEAFTLSRGQSIAVATAGFKVGYEKLVDDSRCKPGNVCVWEGDATLKVSVAGGSVELHTSKQSVRSTVVSGYTVALMELDTAGTVATFQVTKA